MTRSQRRFNSKSYRRIKIRKGESRHHLRCRSRGGGNEESNISIVPKHLHEYWHAIFSNLEPPVIAQVINAKWLDPRWKFICVRA